MPAKKKTAKKARKPTTRKAKPKNPDGAVMAAGLPQMDIPWDEPPQGEIVPPAQTSCVLDAPEALPDVVLDRSTIERYIECPLAGWAVETGKVAIENRAMVSGQECHRILAEAIGAYSEHGLPPRDYIEQETVKARPDVQPDVIDGLKRCSWQIDKMLTSRDPADLVAFDGGDGDKCGQLSVELLPATETRGRVMITSEVDLLMAGNSPEELQEVDWKSGRQSWTSAGVRDSFQFQLHAWLIMKNFPGVKRVLIKVFMTRWGSDTGWVVFTDKILPEIEGRLLMAVQERESAMYQAADGREDQIPCHHTVDDLARCPALHLSKVAKSPFTDLSDDPARFARETMILDAILDNRRELLKQWVETAGENIKGDGFEYGVFPPAERKPTLSQYKGRSLDGEAGQSLRDAIAERMLDKAK